MTNRIRTSAIGKSFDRDHRKIINLVEKYEQDFIELDDKSNQLIREQIQGDRGRPYSEILLNETQFMFLTLLLGNTKKVLAFKEKLARETVKLCLMSER